MYRVEIENNGKSTIIHSPTALDYENIPLLLAGQIKKGINTISTFDFSYLNNNPAYGNLHPLRTLISVTDTLKNKEVFRGRVLSPTDSMESDGAFSYRYLCESELGYLQDSVQKWFKAQNMTIIQFLTYLLSIHNSQVEPYKRFLIGNVTVVNNTDNVYYYVDDSTSTLDTIKDKLLDRLGGELQIRRENGVNYLDYLVEIGKHSNTTIELGKNMILASKSMDPTEVITRIFPRGIRLESEEETNTDASQPRLTIANVNGGIDYLNASQELIDRFGIQGKAMNWDDVTQADILKMKGQQYLDNQKVVSYKYTTTAADLSLLNLDTDTYEEGNYHHTINSMLGINEELRIVGMTLDIISPEVSSLTIGDRFLTQSEYQIELSKARKQLNELTVTSTQQRNQIITINNNVTNLQTMTESEIADIRQEIANLNIGSIENELNQILDLIAAINVRLGSLESDTDWIQLNLGGGVTNSTVYIRNKHGVVYFKGSLTLPVATSAVKLANLNGFSASENRTIEPRLIGQGTDRAQLTIRTDNTIYLEFSTTASKRYSFDSVAYLI
ncbi:phage tail spike protein [Carnobacterium maltaromaticum]|uniref:phage tail spike protein n=1 Tax=Carnobacterium maltaromaticum TaxID=2751 RepID=UPI0039BECB65